jgi:hypothetical protein
VKLGQALSTVLTSSAKAAANLSQLQDDLPPAPFAKIKQRRTSFGAPLDSLFLSSMRCRRRGVDRSSRTRDHDRRPHVAAKVCDRASRKSC